MLGARSCCARALQSEETSSSSDNMGMIGMAVGFVMAALIVAGIVVAVLLIKKK